VDLRLSELQNVKYEIDGRTAVISLDRPHRNNAWTGRLDTEYRWCLDQADRDPAVRVIVVTGTGERFSVGGDSEALESHADKRTYDNGIAADPATPGYGVRSEFDHPFAGHYGLTKPVIAAVNGAAAGIGFALACFADLRFATPGAKMTTAHGKLGLPPEYGLSWVLPRLVGLGRALDLLLSSRVILAEEALDWGLINQIHPADRLLDETLAYAEQLAGSISAGALAASRAMTYADLHRDVGSSIVDSVDRLTTMMGGEEYREGVAALVEKRPPNF
jgi:enoyl-CoA hydratase/carnithine racemase